MLKAGIVGLPNVGKSTLFNALVGNNQAEAGNFPFCTIEPNIGIVNVPDERLEIIRKIVNGQKIVPAAFQFVDIAGLVQGASEGAGLGNKFLSHIREVDAIVQVIRCFEDENIHHVDGSVNPYRDFETIKLELMLADLAVIEKRIERLSKQAKAQDKAAIKEIEILNNLKISFEKLEYIHEKMPTENLDLIKHLNLLSLKPFIVAANLKENELRKPENNKHYKTLISKLPIIPISAQIEAELCSLEEGDKLEYLEELGIKESGIQTLIRASFEKLGLMSYFTAGETEVRAWTIPINCKAPQAAGAIHSDFERGFIKAEIVSYPDLIHYGSKLLAKEAGKVRLEGKDYIVQDGDIIEFRFNV